LNAYSCELINSYREVLVKWLDIVLPIVLYKLSKLHCTALHWISVTLLQH